MLNSTPLSHAAHLGCWAYQSHSLALAGNYPFIKFLSTYKAFQTLYPGSLGTKWSVISSLFSLSHLTHCINTQSSSLLHKFCVSFSICLECSSLRLQVSFFLFFKSSYKNTLAREAWPKACQLYYLLSFPWARTGIYTYSLFFSWLVFSVPPTYKTKSLILIITTHCMFVEYKLHI